MKPITPVQLCWPVLVLLLVSGCDRQPEPSESMAEAADDSLIEHALKHADPTYVCPMHPQIVRGEPGSCPICGMDLVPVETEPDDDEDHPAIKLSAGTVQNMGVRTATVERGVIWRYIETVGYVSYDEEQVAHVHPRSEGWVEALMIRSEGERVDKGKPLLEIYSPEVVAAQEELIAAGQTNRSLLPAARERLRMLDVPPSVIRQVEKSGKVRRAVPIFAPISGVVAELGLREGMYVNPQLELFSIADLSSIWVLVDVFEHQMSMIERGRPAEITVAALPGQVFEGEVDYIYPELDPVTRTLRVRLRFPNPDGQLKPNMLADVVIFGGPKRGVLTIPREAIILSGRGTRVVKALGEGRYQPVEISTGIGNSEQVEILAGLEQGEQVVVSGQFLIDSESNLRASFARMTGGAETPAAQ